MKKKCLLAVICATMAVATSIITFASESYNNTKNQSAVAAYHDMLQKDRYRFPESTKMAVFDANKDGVYEVFAYAPAEIDAYVAAYILSYNLEKDAVDVIPVLSDAFSYIPQTGQMLCQMYQMGIHSQVYQITGSGLQKTEEFSYYDHEDPQYEMNPAESDRNEKRAGDLKAQTVLPELIPVTQANLNQYLTGSGVATPLKQGGANQEMETTGMTVDSTAETTSFDLDAEIQKIQDTYAYTNNHINQYEKTSTNKKQSAWEAGDSNTYYYQGDIQVKQVIVDSENQLSIEVYDKNPAIDASAVAYSETYAEAMMVFVFATGGDGSEYRMYAKDGKIIRYIGPDHQVVDYPQGIDLHTFSLEERNKLSGGSRIPQILNTAFPGWWTAYEGEEAA